MASLSSAMAQTGRKWAARLGSRGVQASYISSRSQFTKGEHRCVTSLASTSRSRSSDVNTSHIQVRDFPSGSRAALPLRGSSTLQAKRRFFSLPDISRIAKIASSATATSSAATAGEGEVEQDGDRQIYHARKILPYSQKQLYQLVSDVPAYSSFIPFCTSSIVLRPGDTKSGSASTFGSKWKPPEGGPFEVDAELRVGFGGFEEAYISRVKGVPYERVEASATEAPLFKSLSTTWSFSPASSSSPHPSAGIPSSTGAIFPSTQPGREATVSNSEGNDTIGEHAGPTLLSIDLAFEFSNPLHRIASQAVLPQVANRMVEAFEKRCLEIWGPGRA